MRPPLQHGIRSRPGPGRGFWWWWAGWTAVIFALGLLWSFASPIPSGPDEPTQLVKAAAVAHGIVVGTPVPGSRDLVQVHVAGTYVNAGSAARTCVYRSPATTGGCAPPVVASSRSTPAVTYVGRYPPLYYAVVGLPSLVSSAPWTLGAMRAMSALLNAAVLGLAFAATRTWARSSGAAVALAVTVTPMAVYLASVVNPNGLEISAAIAAWMAGALLVVEHAEDPPPLLVGVFCVACVLLCASRTLSTVWFGLIVAALVAVRPGASLRLSAHRSVRIGLGVTAVLAVLSGIFVVAADSYAFESFPLPKGTTPLQIMALIAGDTQRFFVGTIGYFGAPDTAVPALVVAVWVVAVSALVVTAMTYLGRRDAWVLAGLGVAYLFVIPFAIIFSHAASNGITWQGRYGYPIYAGVPILAGVLLGGRIPVPARARWLAAGGVTVGMLGAFYWLLRRYVVGIAPTHLDPFAQAPGRWIPPVPLGLVVGLGVAATLAYAIMLGRLEPRGPARSGRPYLNSVRQAPGQEPLGSAPPTATPAP